MFFYAVLGVIALCNAWVFFRLCRAFGRGWWQAAFVLWLAFPVGTWYMRHVVPPGAFWSFVMQAGFVGIGFSAIAAGVCLAAWLIEVTLRLCRPNGALLRIALTPRRSVPTALLLALLLSAYAVWEANTPRAVHVVIPTAKLPAGVERFRIAAVSDIHLSRTIGPEFLEKIAAIVNDSEPDIFVTLGDIVDTDMRGRDADAAVLRSIRSRYGSYGVLGNHEEYRGLGNSLAFHKAAGITVLRGEALRIGPILAAGVDDPRIPGAGAGAVRLARELKAERGRFVLFLSHRPQAPAVIARGRLFNLMLSGHTHGGQIQPAGLIFTHFVHKAPQGLSEYAGALRYTSNGAGYWGPPMRLFAPPEVVIIDLVPESSPQPGP